MSAARPASAAPSLPATLRSQLVAVLAELVRRDLDEFPDLPITDQRRSDPGTRRPAL
jgi:hypothetical protein